MTEKSNIPKNDTDDLSNRRGLAWVVVGIVMLTACMSMFPVYGSRIRELFSINAEQFAEMMGLNNIGRFAGLLAVGPLIAMVGARRVGEFSTLGIGGGFLIVGIGRSLQSLRIGMTVLGVFFGLFGVAIPALLISLFPERKRGMFSVSLVAIALPGMLFPLLAGQLLKWSDQSEGRELSNSLFWPFLIAGSLLVIAALFLAVWKREAWSKPVEASVATPSLGNQLTGILRQLSSLRSLLIVVLISLHGSADNSVFTFLPMFMESHFDELPISTAWVISAHGLAYLITRGVLSLLPEGLGQRAILIFAGPLGGLIVIATLWYSPAIAIPVFYLLASLMFAAEFPTLASEVSSRSLGEFGSVLAAGLLISEVTTFALLKVTGRLADTTGDYRVALSVAACGFIAFGCIALVTGIGRKDRPNN